MLYETDYWFWESTIPSNLCDDIVQHGLSKQESKAFTGTSDDPTPEETADKIRQSNVSWLNDRWIYDTLHPYVTQANKSAGWNFDWDWSESIQFTKYKLNQFYDWHQDAYDKVYPESHGPNQAGKIRKLSIIVTLVDGSEYDGGDLQINFRHRSKIDDIKTITEIRPKGSVIVFPSYIFHRVTPVTRGTRYSLVNWNIGYPYR